MPAGFQQSLRLKYKMLRQLNIVVFLFYLGRFMQYFFQGLNTVDQYANDRFQTAIVVSETILFTFMLWIYRPRNKWP